MSQPGQRWPPTGFNPAPAPPPPPPPIHAHHGANDGGLLDLASIPDAALGTGTPGSTVFLRGDRTWATPAGGGGAPAFPSGATVMYEVGSLSALSAGDPVGQWDDDSGNAKHLTSTGTARPTYRTGDGADGIPFVEFDGSDDFLQNAALSALNDDEITMYAVVRFKSGGSFPGIISLSDASNSDWNHPERLTVEIGTGSTSSPFTRRNNIAIGRAFSPAAGHGDQMRWGVLVVRYATKMATHSELIAFQPGWVSVAPFTANNFTFTHVVLGGRRSSGTIADFARCDFRAMALFPSAHSEAEMRDALAALAAEYKVFGLE